MSEDELVKFDSADRILDFAIQNEQNAADFYNSLAGKMESDDMKEVFIGFAAEELGHKSRLIAVKDGKQLVSSEGNVQDLKIGDYLVDIEMKPDLDYREALIVAMKAEKAAFRLYRDLAAAAKNDELKSLFLRLAQEEAKHKLRFETAYDDEMMNEN
ncbi:MAG: ferritin family protein [Candidatus Zixiibacteriota bacterium]|nr:MAG: ferritin family protein [candidate division Zixibacteria bacterium]